MKKNVRFIVTSLLMACAVAVAQAQSKRDQQIAALSDQIANKMVAHQKTSLVIADFADLQGNVNDFGRFLSEEITTRFYDLGKYKVTDRERLIKVIAEQGINLSSGIEPIAAKQIGKSLGIDTLIVGTITPLVQSVRVNVRLIGVDTGEVFAAASAEIEKDDTVAALLAGNVKKASTSPKPSPQPAPGRKPTKILVEDEEYVFDFERCKMDAEATVLCYLTVRNDFTKDIRFQVLAEYYDDSTRLVDGSGNEYIVDTVWFGKQVGNRTEGATNTLIPQLPTKLVLKFRNVSPQATKATLSIHCYLPRFGGGPYFKANIRDIQVEK